MHWALWSLTKHQYVLFVLFAETLHGHNQYMQEIKLTVMTLKVVVGVETSWSDFDNLNFRQHAASIYGLVRLFVCMLRYVTSKKNLEHF